MEEIKARSEEMMSNTQKINDILSQQAIASEEGARGISGVSTKTTQNVSGIETIVNAISTIEEEVANRITLLAKFDVPGKVVKLAKSDHVAWKKRLINMMVGREKVNADELTDHHQCRLGKWYDVCQETQYTSSPLFKALSNPHQEVHSHGKQAVRLFNAGMSTVCLWKLNKLIWRQRKFSENFPSWTKLLVKAVPIIIYANWPDNAG